jgi:hypothetical protein
MGTKYQFRVADKQKATRLVNVIIVTPAAFFILTDVYLIFAAVH